MEKLSDASEALEMGVVKQDTAGAGVRLQPRARAQTITQDYEIARVKQTQKSMLDSLGERRHTERLGLIPSNMEGSTRLGSLPPLTTPTEDSPFGDIPSDSTRPSITERRGVKALPPIQANGSTSQPPTHKHAVLASRKGKNKLQQDQRDSEEDSDYSADLKAYMESYIDSSQGSHSSLAQEMATTGTPKPPSPLMPGLVGTSEVPAPNMVKEGSLAIGLDARDNFAVETVEEWSEVKGGKKQCQTRKEIVQTSTPADATPSHADNSTPRNQSRLCTIL